MTSLSQLEADEAFARQLQAQEEYGGDRGIHIQLGPVQHGQRQTPRSTGEGDRENPTVLNSRLNQFSNARAVLAAIVVIHLPQVIAAAVILPVYWNDTYFCDDLHRNRWKWWALISGLRMFSYISILCFMHFCKEWLQGRPRILHNVTNIRNIVDGMGLVWFVVGNMWIFGDSNSCSDEMKSPVYDLCLGMLIVSYVQICLPCILAVMLIPIFCFCMPCLIRVLARIHETSKGATEAAIEAIPSVTLEVGSELLGRGDNTCPICLSDMVVGEKVRILNCKHFFHNACVDEWLRVNASCPTCRESILSQHDVETGGGSLSSNEGGASVSTSTSRRDGRVVLAVEESEENDDEEEEERRRASYNQYHNNSEDIESRPLCP